ncbi:MAG: FmdE family protein [Desulforegulaceae bacterium]|nr:FmdE family protein [Desulforegulaceae bacterium]
MKIRNFTVDEYIDEVKKFHGHLAPGMLCGGFMVELILKNLPENGFYDVICETRACLPDAVQILTPCTIGNGWLKIFDTGRFSMIFYDKYSGYGVRACLDQEKLLNWPEFKIWANKEKPKKDQNTPKIFEEITKAGISAYKTEKVFVELEKFKKEKGNIKICLSCKESFRTKDDSSLCDSCSGKLPVKALEENYDFIEKISVDESAGKKALHDMTRIVKSSFKGPAILKDEVIENENLNLLKKMGKNSVFVKTGEVPGNFLHEDEAVKLFAKNFSGENTFYSDEPREGKINIKSLVNGIFVYDGELLKSFNSCDDVMCAAKKSFSTVKENEIIAGTRAIPLYITKDKALKAAEVIENSFMFKVYPFVKKNIGLIVTGTEVYNKKITDAFIPVMKKKIREFDLESVYENIVPDKIEHIEKAVKEALNAKSEIIIITGGLSVDPDDVTRKGLRKAGLKNEIYGAPVLPGAMTITGEIGPAKVIGVPAGGIYFEKTAFDLVFPRLLADLTITRSDIASLGAGGFLDI